MPQITNTFITKLKKQAKAERKTSRELSLTQIQDEIARGYGYLNWRTLIRHPGKGAVLVEDAERWFYENYTPKAETGRTFPSIDEPGYIFDIIQQEFDLGLDYGDGGRIAELAENLALDDAWVDNKYYHGEV